MARDLGTVLKEARIRKGVSVQELGRIAAVDAATISRIESGVQPDVRFFTLLPLCEALGLPIAQLAKRLGSSSVREISPRRPFKDDVADLERQAKQIMETIARIKRSLK